jgi:hypothetical protein
MKNSKLIIVLVGAAAVLIWIFSRSSTTSTVSGPLSPSAIAAANASSGISGALANISKSLGSLFGTSTSSASSTANPFAGGLFTNTQLDSDLGVTPGVTEDLSSAMPVLAGATDPLSGTIDDTSLLDDPSGAEDAVLV